MSAISSFKSIKNNHGLYKGKDSMKKFCESITECAMEIINFKKKKNEVLTNKHKKSYQNANLLYL